MNQMSAIQPGTSSKGQGALSSLLQHPSAIQSPLTVYAAGPRMGVFSNASALASSDLPRRAKVTATSNIKASAKGSPLLVSSTKKPSRDTSRRATHSQIERRRREKINDRLVTLRTLVPACAAEIEERKRQRRQEEEEARQIAAGEKVASNVPGKRKRNRRRASKAEEGAKEDELGLHKLEVLTHTIEYIYELQDEIRELKGGERNTTLKSVARKHQHREEDEEEDSEADLEMAEWKPSAKRKLVDINSHRSNASSSVSSLNASPAIMSLSAESPMFSTAAPSSSNSAFTNLTSPMMSLSSESPILRWNNRTSSSPSCNQEVSRKEAGTSWKLPAPALPFDDRFDKRLNKYDSAQDARLLLNLGSSPEVLRPTSALRQTTTRPALILQRRKSTTMSAGNTRATAKIGGSAPGGARPISPLALVSPPLLDLNADSTYATKSQEGVGESASSDL